MLNILKWSALLFIATAASVQTYAQGDTVRITSFGYQPNSRANAVGCVKQALAVCKTKAHPVLVFAPGPPLSLEYALAALRMFL